MKLLVTGGAGYVGPEKPALEAIISDAWEWTRAHPNWYE